MQNQLPGDIFLYRSNTWISWAIRKLDGTEVSHAGLFMGEDVAEALIASGLTRRPVKESIKDCEWVQVRRMKESPGPMKPVLEVAEDYLAEGNRYAYEQILLLVGICLTRKMDLQSPTLKRLVRSAIKKSTQWLEHLHQSGKEPMICSEFVFRTYDEALPEDDDPYSLEIRSPGEEKSRRRFSLFRRLKNKDTDATPPTIHPDSILAKLEAQDFKPGTRQVSANQRIGDMPEAEEEMDAIIQQYKAELEGEKPDALNQKIAAGPEVSMDEIHDSAKVLLDALAQTTIRKARANPKLFGSAAERFTSTPPSISEIFADFVTPGDLLKSPSLKLVGELSP